MNGNTPRWKTPAVKLSAFNGNGMSEPKKTAQTSYCWKWRESLVNKSRNEVGDDIGADQIPKKMTQEIADESA